jgi:hypothetical protein
MQVEVEVRQIQMQGDYCEVDAVQAACRRCGHCVESFGTSDRSIRRCLVLLREECPNGGSNFYVER